MAANQEVVKKEFEEIAAQRFTARVEEVMKAKIKQGLDFTEEQKRLMQNYFIEIDKTLKKSELNRNTSKYPLSYSWNNIDLNEVAYDVVHFARMGLDPCQKDNLWFIPYMNNKKNMYEINFMAGYIGLEIITKKYALELPLAVTVELVHANDNFKPYKKGRNQLCDDYEFEIINPFDRGNILGGFAYIQYREPEKNKLIIMTMADIEKRKNIGYGNPEFWGGEKTVWKGKQQVKEHTDGWLEEMCLKTIKRKVYGGTVIPINPSLIDEDFTRMKQREQDYQNAEMMNVVETHTATVPIDDYEIKETDVAKKYEATAVPEPEPQAEEEPEAETEQIEMDEFDDDPGY